MSRARNKRYNQSMAGKETRRRYWQSAAGKATKERFRIENPGVGAVYTKRYRKTTMGKINRQTYSKTQPARETIRRCHRRLKYECLRHICEGREPNCQFPGCDVRDLDMLHIEHRTPRAVTGEIKRSNNQLRRNILAMSRPMARVLFSCYCANHHNKKTIEEYRDGVYAAKQLPLGLPLAKDPQFKLLL